MSTLSISERLRILIPGPEVSSNLKHLFKLTRLLDCLYYQWSFSFNFGDFVFPNEASKKKPKFKHFLHIFFARLPKQKSSVWMRAEKVLIIFTSHSVPNQYQSPIKPHKRFKQTQHTELFSKSIDGRGMNVWSGVHFLSIKNVWLVERDSRYIQISYRNGQIPLWIPAESDSSSEFSLHVQNIFLCSPFRASFYFCFIEKL